MSSRKRSRSGVEENRAECPFKVIVSFPNVPDNDKHASKKRKRETGEDERKTQMQLSPFSPIGKFKTYETLDLHYSVEPRKRWLDMTRYNSFVLNGTKYYSEGFVFVANETTIERQKTAPSADGSGLIKKSTDDWVARILEIRAADEHHVYARVYWMYWPDELPAGTLDGKKTVQGRQAYHGQNELIASNHMDIINVVSVTMPATVNQMIESEDDEIQDALYWRQAFDVRTSQLSPVELVCKCETPGNPDKTLIGCTNKECEKWLHYDCLLHDVLMRVYEELGTDKPHKADTPAVKTEKDDERPTRPLSPAETKGEQTQPTIDVKPEEGMDQVTVKKADEESSQSTSTKEATTSNSESLQLDSTPKTLALRKGRKKEGKPYLGLFEATLKMNDGPTVWDIKDLRKNVWGGDSTWTEQAHCLICGHAIN